MSNVEAKATGAVTPPAQIQTGLSHTAVAFGAAAAIAILFNTLLALVKDKVPALNTAMASLTGHHWITHGIAVVAVFFIVGIVFTLRFSGDRKFTNGNPNPARIV